MAFSNLLALRPGKPILKYPGKIVYKQTKAGELLINREKFPLLTIIKPWGNGLIYGGMSELVYLLFALLIVMLLVAYQLNGKNILSPWVISILMYLLTVGTFILSRNYFQYSIHHNTILAVMGTLSCIGLGELSAIAWKQHNRKKGVLLRNNIHITRERRQSPIIIRTSTRIIICMIMFAVFIFYYNKMYAFSLSCGNPGSYINATKYVREAVLADPELSLNMGTLLTQGVLASEMISYVFCYLYFYNRMNFKTSLYSYWIPVLIYSLQTINSTGRTDIIRLVVVISVCAFVFMKKDARWTRKNDVRIVRNGIILISLSLIIFRLLGYLTEASLRYDIWENFARYISASMVGTDQFVNSASRSSNVVFGQETLKNIYAILRQVGFDIPRFSNFAETYILVRGTSNAYMNLCGFIRDYGILGMCLIQFFIGYIYTNLIYKIRAGRDNLYPVIWLGILFFPIAMSAIANTYSSIVSIASLYKVGYLYLFNQLLFRNKAKLLADARIPARNTSSSASSEAF